MQQRIKILFVLVTWVLFLWGAVRYFMMQEALQSDQLATSIIDAPGSVDHVTDTDRTTDSVDLPAASDDAENNDIGDNNTGTHRSTLLRMYIPHRIPQQDLSELEQIAWFHPDITVEITQAPHEQAYWHTLAQRYDDPHSFTYDLALIPSTRYYELAESLGHIPFTQDISPLFAAYLRPLIISPDATFVPFALDPLVTLVHNNAWSISANLTHQRIQQILRTPRETTLPYLPLLFGFDADEVALLRMQRFPFATYSDVAVTLVRQAIDMQDSSILLFYRDIPDRSTTLLRNIISTVSERLSVCSSFIIGCIVRFGLVDVGLIYVSDLDRIDELLPQGTAWERHYTWGAFPTRTLSYPVRWRGIVMVEPSSGEEAQVNDADSRRLRDARIRWIQTYLQYIVQERFTSNSYTLSPLNAVRATQLLHQRYLHLKQQLQFGALMTNYKSFGDRLWNDESFYEMLQGERRIQLFLQQF